MLSFSPLPSPVHAVGLQPQESSFAEVILHGRKSALNRGDKFIADLSPSWKYPGVQERLGEKIQCMEGSSSVLPLPRNSFGFVIPRIQL